MYDEFAAKNTHHSTLNVTMGFTWDLVKGGRGMSGKIEVYMYYKIFQT